MFINHTMCVCVRVCVCSMYEYVYFMSVYLYVYISIYTNRNILYTHFLFFVNQTKKYINNTFKKKKIQ